MMKSIRKFGAVADIKWQCICNNMTVLLGPVLSLGLVIGMKYLYGTSSDNGQLAPVLTALIMNMGLSMNICMDGFFMIGTIISEEKEKHTLRVLMTSSVSGLQYFWGTICIPFVLTMLMNVAILFASGCTLSGSMIPVFLTVTGFATLISCVIGMIIGVYAKNQVSASLIATPLLMVFAMVPIFGEFSDGLKKFSGYLFTGVMTQMAGRFSEGKVFHITGLHMLVLGGELLAAVIIFLVVYKKNGYESD